MKYHNLYVPVHRPDLSYNIIILVNKNQNTYHFDLIYINQVQYQLEYD